MYAVIEFIRGALTDRLFLRLTPKTKKQPDANPVDAAMNAAGRGRFLPLLFLAFLFCSPHPAFAACASPAGVEGQIVYNGTFHVLQYCDNLNVWNAMGASGPGAGGAGCSNPAGVEGQMMYNQTYHMLQYCDGTTWKAVTGASSSGGGNGPTSGLVGWWRLDETSGTVAADSWGGNTGTVTPNATGVWVAGKINNAANLNGTSQYIDVANRAPFNFDMSNSFTLAAWIYRNSSADTDDEIMGKLVTGTNTGYTFYMVDNGNANSCVFAPATSCTSNCLIVSFTNSSSNGCVVAQSTPAAPGAWHHVVMTYNGNINLSGVKIYVDGVSQTVTVPGSPTGSILNNVDFLIGEDLAGVAADLFGGKIDDARVYNRVLSATEVTALYNATSGIYNTCDGVGLVGYWKLDEAAGTSAADSSGNANTGTLVNTPTWGAGKINNALTFNGTTQYVDAGNPASLQLTSSLTVSAWVNATTYATTDRSIITKGSTVGGAQSYKFFTSTDCGSTRFEVEVSSDGTATTDRCSNTIPVAGTWYLVTGVYNAGAQTLDIYVNGVLDDKNPLVNSAVPASIHNTAIPARIGVKGNTVDYFAGTIDDARIYNRALSSGEISSLYNTGSDAVEGQLMYNATSHIPQFCDGTSWHATK